MIRIYFTSATLLPKLKTPELITYPTVWKVKIKDIPKTLMYILRYRGEKNLIM